MRHLALPIAFALLLPLTSCDSDEAATPATDQPIGQPLEEPATEAAELAAPAPPELILHGALRNVNLHGDYSATVTFEDLADSDPAPTHGLGALGGLTGEATLWDDRVFFADAGEEPRFSSTPLADVTDRDATFFFGAAVSEWRTADSITGPDLAALQSSLEAYREAADLDGALSFRITDPLGTVEWHVTDSDLFPEDEDQPSSCGERKEFSHQFETTREPVRIVGIYTTDHTGVVVDHTTSIHAHVITDRGHSGHIDALTLSDYAVVEIAVR